jgi:16S rRNA (guanine(966)-N(2))-methyltransferase RsmD
MKIHGSRSLKTLSGQMTRPTTARVREAISNIWQGKIAGCRWLDLCAGSGAMGGEALSRGAALVVGIERSPKAIEIIRHNWQKIATPAQEFRILRGELPKYLEKLAGETFDRIYFDPPYESGLYNSVLEAITNYGLLDKDGELAVEHDVKFWKAIELEGLTIAREKKYGNTSVTFYHP